MPDQLNFFNDEEQPAVTVHRYDPYVGLTLAAALNPTRVQHPGVRILFRDALTDYQLRTLRFYLRHMPILPKFTIKDQHNVICYPNEVAPLGLGQFEDMLRATRASCRFCC